QQVEAHDQGRETIDPPPLRVQVDELRGLPRILRDRGQVVIPDDIRDEAFLVLYLHRVEGAAVAVDADKEFVALLELTQETLGIARLHLGFFLSRFSFALLRAGLLSIVS